MGMIKVMLSDAEEDQFRKAAMHKYGYSKGALTQMARFAFKHVIPHIPSRQVMTNPVDEICGLGRPTKMTSVELQHYANELRRARNDRHRRKHLS